MAKLIYTFFNLSFALSAFVGMHADVQQQKSKKYGPETCYSICVWMLKLYLHNYLMSMWSDIISNLWVYLQTALYVNTEFIHLVRNDKLCQKKQTCTSTIDTVLSLAIRETMDLETKWATLPPPTTASIRALSVGKTTSYHTLFDIIKPNVHFQTLLNMLMYCIIMSVSRTHQKIYIVYLFFGFFPSRMVTALIQPCMYS